MPDQPARHADGGSDPDDGHPKPPAEIRDPRSYRADADYDAGADNQGADAQDDAGGSKDKGKDGDAQAQTNKKSFFKRPAVLIIGGLVLLILLVAAGVLWRNARRWQSTDDATIDAHIVHLAPQISGRVVSVSANDNQLVAPGQPLVRIDPVDADIRLRQAQAQRAQAVAQREQAQAQKRSAAAQIVVSRRNAEQAAAQVSGAQAQARSAASDLARYEGLARINPKAVAGQQIDNSRAQAAQTASQAAAARKAAAAAAAQVEQARTQVLQSDAQIAAADAQIAAADAQIASAGVNQGYARIVSPVYGHVTRRTVAVGAYVQPGQELMAITPLDLWVTANFKETQLQLMRPGQAVEIKVDAYPDVKFRGHVDSIQRGAGQAFAVLPAENATGNFVKVVQRVPVKIVIDNLDDAHHPLGPGMSVEPRVRGALVAQAAVAGWSAERSAAGDRNPWLIAVVISISAFMEVLDTSIANVALQHIGGGLAVSYDETTWVLTSYLIANAIVIPASGWLSTVLGRKRYYMISVAVFTAASFVCGIAPNLTVLIFARIVQGAAGGGLQPSTQSMLIDSFPPAKRGAALGLFGFTIVLAPAVGPVLGGWITDSFHWSWIFLINVPVGLISLFLVQSLVAEPPALKAESKKAKAGGLKFDLPGFAFIGVGLGTLEIAADRGQQDNWFSNPVITVCAVLAVAGLVGFVVWENVKKTDTLLDLSLFKNRNFLICNLVMMITGVVLYGTTQFLPQLLQQVQGYTATRAGLAMTFGGLATLIVMPIAAGLSGKVQPRWLILFGLVVEALALLNMTGLSTGMSFWDAAFSRVWQAIGIPFLFVPLTNAAYVGLPATSTSQASAMLNVFRNLGGTLGISSVQTLLAQREQFHQSRMVENLNGLNPAYTAALQQAGAALQPALGSGAQQGALSQIYAAVTQQAAMLSYVDVFWALMVFVALVTPAAFLLKNAPAGGGKGGAA